MLIDTFRAPRLKPGECLLVATEIARVLHLLALGAFFRRPFSDRSRYAYVTLASDFMIPSFGEQASLIAFNVSGARFAKVTPPIGC